VDEDAYRQIYREVNDRQCLYEKAILSTQCNCALMRKICLAEREAVHCEDKEAHGNCAAFLDILRQKGRFALSAREQNRPLPHAKAMRLQVGGLRGLHAAVHPDQPIPVPIPDIHGLLREAQERWHSLDALPYQVVVQEIASWEGRKPRRRRKDR